MSISGRNSSSISRLKICRISTRQRLQLPGVLILNVAKGSTAEEAGLRPTTQLRNGRITLGDIITHVGNHKTPDENALLNTLEKYEVGQTVDLTIERDGETRVVPVRLESVG